jgi:hypothetical protein
MSIKTATKIAIFGVAVGIIMALANELFYYWIPISMPKKFFIT